MNVFKKYTEDDDEHVHEQLLKNDHELQSLKVRDIIQQYWKDQMVS